MSIITVSKKRLVILVFVTKNIRLLYQIVLPTPYTRRNVTIQMICINKPRGCPETFGIASRNTKEEISLLIIIKKVILTSVWFISIRKTTFYFWFAIIESSFCLVFETLF